MDEDEPRVTGPGAGVEARAIDELVDFVAGAGTDARAGLGLTDARAGTGVALAGAGVDARGGTGVATTLAGGGVEIAFAFAGAGVSFFGSSFAGSSGRPGKTTTGSPRQSFQASVASGLRSGRPWYA